MKSNQIKCHRCGTCCQKNSPALHLEDLPLITDGHIAKNQLITYRKGEWIYDNVANTFIKLDQELIKPVMKNYCIFYLHEDHSCAIYNNRPLECQIQLCSDPLPLKDMYQKNRLARQNILSSESPLLELIEYHEKNCTLSDLPKSSKDLTNSIKLKLKSMIQFEYHFRFTLYQQTGLQQSDMIFLLGRPIEKLLQQARITL